MISEIDMNDWERSDPMPLYQVRNKNYVEEQASKGIFFFDHIDGAYSYCLDSAGNVVHWSASTLVVALKRRDTPTVS